ncbi:MAG: hypothetical protein PHE20_01985 [Patescibacteria group bacterium]|nr:hypothetical protein [Patescibacteria group bacterium]
MSLSEKLEQKRAAKEKEAEEIKKMSVQEKIDIMGAEMSSLIAKKERILTITSALKDGYLNADSDLSNFKNKKEVLKNIFDENEDILKEDGVEDFDDMLVKNADESEVKQYRKSGVRSPKDGETGKLYQSVEGISNLKNQLEEEMPELKLNFSARKVNNQDINQRELSFQKIEGYINSLDLELEELKEKQAETLLETDEGKKEAIIKNAEESNLFNYAEIERPTSFSFSDKQIELASQFGEDTVKDIYVEMLSEKMKNNILSGIKYRAENDYGQTGQENALLNYHKLKQLMAPGYNYKIYQNCENLKNEAINHLAELFKDKQVRSSVNELSQGLGRIERYENWNIENILADQYILHASEMSNIGLKDIDGIRDYNRLVEAFAIDRSNADNGKRTNNSGYIRSAEYYNDNFNNYSKFFEYIINNTNKETKFISDTRDGTSLSDKFRKEENRNEIGLKKTSPEDRGKYLLHIPDAYISKNGGIDKAWEKSKIAQGKWEETEKKIEALSKASIELRWTEIADSNFKDVNKDVLEKISEIDTLINSLEINLRKASYLSESKFAERKIKLKSTNGASSESNSIVDVEYEESYKNNSSLLQENKEKSKKYTNELLQKNSEAINSLKNKAIVLGRNKKINELNRRDYAIKKCAELDGAVLEKEDIITELSAAELAIIKEFIDRKNELDREYRKNDQERIEFYQLHKNLKIDFKEHDVLNNQEMTVKELYPMLLNRLKELKDAKENAPNEIIAIRKKKIDLDEKSALARDNFKKQSSVKINF